MRREFVQQVDLPVGRQTAFAWHERQGALQRLLPPWQRIRVVSRDPHIRDGAVVVLKFKLGPLTLRWVARHHGYIANESFIDSQTHGPFRYWQHHHQFLKPTQTPTVPPAQGVDRSVCRLKDRVDYELPAGWIGQTLLSRFVHHQLVRMFQYRHQTTLHDLKLHHQHSDQTPMTVAISGASGLVGTALSALLTTGGHVVRPIVRRPPADHEISWDPIQGTIELDKLADVNAVIHLAGDNIASGRWTRAKKDRMIASRVQATRQLCEALAGLRQRPQTLICASAIGFYGDRQDEPLDESSSPGSGFLAEVCHQWEQASQIAQDAGIRTIQARFGVILSPQAGALSKMLPVFRVGLGGRIGHGRQIWSWISLDDAIGALYHLLMTPSVSGPVNVVSPQPLTNTQFTQELASVLGRPALLPVPRWAARLAMGEMVDPLLMASARVTPTQLNESGYEFRHSDLATALRHVLGRTDRSQ